MTTFQHSIGWVTCIAFLSGGLVIAAAPEATRSKSTDTYPPGWSVKAPRDEIRPGFSFDPKGGPKQSGSLVIRHDERDGLDGWFQKSFAVKGGEFVRFQAARRLTDVPVPRRSASSRAREGELRGGPRYARR